ncbi:hypothetical protein [Planomonospora parontospora]|uniref:hypothetical protein n=1 Tax=Planomonospora parontospora TaxID=58119 RepID=UPI00166F7995|nr:hypothetical protein [Planomonospora parontospora]GGL15143.1 hypothetical protein GCM10014719_16480 [Planomonospora parontospora subsp. antibiotica]GII15922.1 hypothetical protein Ppa05_26480 [Planomonospora parontospora subsp. antibiotica]
MTEPSKPLQAANETPPVPQDGDPAHSALATLIEAALLSQISWWRRSDHGTGR